MSSFREHPGEFGPSQETPAPADVALAIGTDERRMHVRAYNYWVSLLNERDFPSIEDLEPGEVEDFASNSVLLDFTCGRDNPAIPYVGAAIRDECALDDDVRTIADVPSRSLLSRLTDHYMQIIANRSPVGFEAEFENPHGRSICYRGILMPFSSDGDAIDFIYGVINWKHVGADADDSFSPIAPQLLGESGIDSEGIEIAGIEDEALELTDVLESDPVEPASIEPGSFDSGQTDSAPFDSARVDAGSFDSGPIDSDRIDLDPVDSGEPASSFIADEAVETTAFADPNPEAEKAASVHFSWEDGPLADADDVPILDVDENAGLADRLWAARETAESVKAGEGRTRAALYRALSLAYDFAIAAQQNHQEYAELLEESGVTAQARAPMTPIVKLVFGIDYDKARLTEFAAALSFAQRREIGLGGFQDFIDRQPGGLKALVAAERQARRPEPRTDSKGDVARARLRAAPSISLDDLPRQEEFALVVTRRGQNGAHELVAIIDDEALVERAIRRAA